MLEIVVIVGLSSLSFCTFLRLETHMKSDVQVIAAYVSTTDGAASAVNNPPYA